MTRATGSYFQTRKSQTNGISASAYQIPNNPHVIYPVLKDLLDGYDNEDEKEGDDGRVPARGGHIGDLLHSEGR